MACNLLRSLLRANMDEKMSSCLGFWLCIRTVSLRLTYKLYNGNPLSPILGKKLAVVLKTLLAIEAMAKVVFIVETNIIQQGIPLWLRNLNYGHIYRYL